MNSASAMRPSNLLPGGVAAVGALLGLGLLVFVRPPTAEEHRGTALQLWYTTGADESKPQAPVWFNESQDEIYIERVGLPFMQIEQKFLTSVVGNVAPDLFEYFGSVAQWSARGALLPLDEFMERDGFDRSRVFDSLWGEMTWEGKTFALPTGVGCDAFYWNKDHFREAGLDPEKPPATWDKLEEFAHKLVVRNEEGEMTRAGYIPGYWSPMSVSGYPIFLFWPAQLGAKFVSNDGRKVNLTSEACVQAMEWEAGLFRRLGGDDLVRMRNSFGYADQQGFISGQVSMIAQKNSFVQELRKFAPELDYGVSLFPVPEGGHPSTTFGPVWIGIPACAKHPEQAWEYIKFYTTDDIQTRSAAYAVDHDQVAFFPANKTAAQSPKQMSVPHMPVFIESMKWGTPTTVVPLAHTVFYREYALAWDNATLGKKTPRQALLDAETEIQRALEGQLDYAEFYRKHLEQETAMAEDRG